jgi:hypothetical protein
MTDAPDAATLDAMIDAGSAALGITIDPAWRDGVRLHLANTLRLARLVDGVALPDETDPAPVFVA